MLDLTAPPDRPLVSASILSADFGRMIDDCRDVLDKGADLLHVDVMDGHFAQNLTMGVDMIRALRKHLPDVFLDVHLMVTQPQHYIEAYAEAGANLFSFHVEVCHPTRGPMPIHEFGHDGHELIERVHENDMLCGMVLNPATPAESLEPFLDRLDIALVMSVVPGKSGQVFMPEVLEKARWIKDRITANTRLEMDGGISPTTAPQAVAAGVDVLVSASAIFGADDRARVIQQLHSSRVQ